MRVMHKYPENIVDRRAYTLNKVFHLLKRKNQVLCIVPKNNKIN